MDRSTVAVYEGRADEYLERRRSRRPDEAAAFAGVVRAGGVRLDAGCGPGIDLGALGEPVVYLDASHAMLSLARQRTGRRRAVQADLAALPFRDGALAGTWSRYAHHHLPEAGLPMALADLHRACEVGALLDLSLVARGEGPARSSDDFPGRFFARWDEASLRDVVVGAGFQVEGVAAGEGHLAVRARRARTLADTVGAGMSVLVCGLNPSLHAADAGVGYAGPGNRFWPAAVEAGLVERGHDARAALGQGVGMTDLVKRATPRAAELTPAELREGAARVERLVRRLAPGAVCFVGVSGYRVAVDRRAATGWQERPFGSAPTYVMPSTSGLNARTTRAELVDHLRRIRETLP